MTESDIKTAIKSLQIIPEIENTDLLICYRGSCAAWIKARDPKENIEEVAQKILAHLNKFDLSEENGTILDIEPPKIREVSGKKVVERDTFLLALRYDYKIDFVEKKAQWAVFEDKNLTGFSNKSLESSFIFTRQIDMEKGSRTHMSAIEKDLGGNYRVIPLWRNDLNGPVFELVPQIRAGNVLAGCIAIKKGIQMRAEDIVRLLNQKLIEKPICDMNISQNR